MSIELSNPGSLADFIKTNPDLSNSEALKSWESKLIEHRQVLVSVLGLENTDQLHLHGSHEETN